MDKKNELSGVTTEIIRDYPGKFYLDEIELKRLTSDMTSLLSIGDQEPTLRYWVGLKNGIIYETKDLEIILAEENSQSLTIRVLILFAEIYEHDDNENPSKRIIVHFSRGKHRKDVDNLHLGGEWFNLNYQGISYRIIDTSREATLKSVSAIEERLHKFRRWYSGFPKLPVNFRFVNLLLVSLFLLGGLLYSMTAIKEIYSSWRGTLFDKTDVFLGGAALGALILFISVALLSGIYFLINWIIPPSIIAIGDEIITSKKKQTLREYIFWSVIVASVVGIIVNIVTR